MKIRGVFGAGEVRGPERVLELCRVGTCDRLEMDSRFYNARVSH